MLKVKKQVKKTVKITGKQKIRLVKKAVTVEPKLLKAQKFLESKKFKIDSIRSRSVYAVSFFQAHKGVNGKEYKAVEVLKGNTSSLPLVGSDTRKAISLITGLRVKPLLTKQGNPNLHITFKLVK